MKKINFQNDSIKKLPKKNGVYIFLDDNENILYVGKATNLRSRVQSYNLKTVTGKTKQLVEQANKVGYIIVNSELESLLLEAKLVKRHLPKYNIQLKDDKHPLYIRITSDDFPKVITARRKDETSKSDKIYGPFPSSKKVRTVLKLLRRIFPYSQHDVNKGRPCFYNQIGLCQPCPNTANKENYETIKQEYNYNINMIKGVLHGRFNLVKKDLKKRMEQYAENEEYEKANETKLKFEALEYITQPKLPPQAFLKNPNMVEDVRVQELQELQGFLRQFIEVEDINRIECYDVAHLQGAEPTASMVTFIDGEPEKSLYRRFKIRQKKGNDDVSSLEEVAKRRLRHLSDWGVPDLIVVDGGKGQVRVFREVFDDQEITVVGLAKRFESIVIPNSEGNKKYIVRKVPNGHALNLLKRLRDEAHRFARRYHHKLLNKILIPDS